jgi:hypothetical protein
MAVSTSCSLAEGPGVNTFDASVIFANVSMERRVMPGDCGIPCQSSSVDPLSFLAPLLSISRPVRSNIL